MKAVVDNRPWTVVVAASVLAPLMDAHHASLDSDSSTPCNRQREVRVPGRDAPWATKRCEWLRPTVCSRSSPEPARLHQLRPTLGGCREWLRGAAQSVRAVVEQQLRQVGASFARGGDQGRHSLRIGRLHVHACNKQLRHQRVVLRTASTRSVGEKSTPMLTSSLCAFSRASRSDCSAARASNANKHGSNVHARSEARLTARRNVVTVTFPIRYRRRHGCECVWCLDGGSSMAVPS